MWLSWSQAQFLYSLTAKLNVSVPTIKVKWGTVSAFGKEITASVKKHQHESGTTLMGNEVYSY